MAEALMGSWGAPRDRLDVLEQQIGSAKKSKYGGDFVAELEAEKAQILAANPNLVKAPIRPYEPDYAMGPDLPPDYVSSEEPYDRLYIEDNSEGNSGEIPDWYLER